jgi:hypothetical protein
MHFIVVIVIIYFSYSWSPFGSDYEEDQADANCGAYDGGESNHWYFGRTECFRANAAYSLYGVLLNSDDTDGCSKQVSNVV